MVTDEAQKFARSCFCSLVHYLLPKDNLFKNPFDFTTAGDWYYVVVVERLPALHYSVDFIFFVLWDHVFHCGT